ncbi:MAG: GTP-binding protein [Lachnospiraceae bacterium]|nr:GTP-binding protein [Lachnospiraceae bacterium]
MQEEEIRVPIYLMTGFLESGKTGFLSFTIEQDYFAIPEKTLLIVCEEGEVEYDEEMLKKNNTVMEVVENEEEFTSEYLMALDIAHNPGRVLIEYNGMWQVSKLEEMQLPKDWGFVQHITTVDGSTFQTYMNNMKSLFMEMVRHADMVLFNRCKMEDPLASYRRSIKVANQSAEVIFEDEEGEIDVFAESLPFDIDAPVIDIAPEDYGIWYVDALDHPEKYANKVVKFKGRVLKPKDLSSKYFVPGRTAMTCCADDTTFIGYICKSPYTSKLKAGDWVEVIADIKVEKQAVYRGEGPVLYAKQVEVCEPLEDEMVYFS